MKDELLSELMIEDLNGDQAQLAAIIGIDAYRSVVANYAGTVIYIPTQSTLLACCRDRMIKDDYERGLSYRDIAVKWGLTTVWIRKIIHGEDSGTWPGQLTMDAIDN